MDFVHNKILLVSIGIVLCLLGIIGNSISVYVLSKLNSKPLRLLRYLNVVDIGLLVMIFFGLMTTILQLERLVPSTLNVFLCTAPLFSTLQTFGAYLTVLIAFVRCLAVAVPFRFSTCMRDSVQNKLLIAIAVFSLLFNVPVFLLWKLVFSDSFSDVLVLVHFHMTYLSLVFSCILPILVIVICNVILVVSRCRMRSLTRHNGECRSPETRRGRGAFQLTCLVLAITAMFIATHGPFGVYKFVVLTSYISRDVALRVVSFTLLMTIINSATNFIFYCLIGSEFRTTLISLCKKRPCFNTRRNSPMPVSSV
ncbi:FMRFamide peptide receptor frpr-18-like [Haliotis asinina]|uniref:FMRFamide peptide receptor frpr-18-like n=1 Tax=Haliotis asinina TaxID=109174 RepID=UPI003532246B